nr:AP2/ERF and B3 domain-containing transcription factor ARF14-like [Lolium perenne]
MPPRRRPSSGYHGVRAWPSGRFDAEIRSGEERIRLGTFDTAHEAARAYDAVARRLGRSRRTLNFHDVFTREQAEMLAPPPPMVTREQQRRHRELEQRLLIAERDKALRLEWARQFPEDVAATEAFYAQKEEEKAAMKAKKKASREKRRAESAARKKWTTSSTPVSDTTLSSSDFDWESDDGEE